MPDPTERIWAPWRIDYILGPKVPGCPFCDAQALGPSAESLIVCERPESFIILNRYPYTGCHVMVVPREHVGRLEDLEPATYSAVMELVRLAAARLQTTCRPSGINIGMNLGTAAGAGIAEHLHVHLVPRWHGDNNFMTVFGGARVLSEGLDHAWQLLRPAFEDLDEPAKTPA